jgi:hypothetical protein
VQLSPYQYSDHRARTRALWSHLGGKIFAGRVLRLVIPPPRLLGQNFPLFHFIELAAKNRRLEPDSWLCARREQMEPAAITPSAARGFNVRDLAIQIDA